MFQQTFVPEAHSGRRPIGIALSLLLQALAVAALAVASLLVRQPMPAAQLRLLFLGPKPPGPIEKPVPKSGTLSQTKASRVHSFRMTAPVIIPKHISTTGETADQAPDIGDVSVMAGGEPLLSGFGGGLSSFAPPKPMNEPEIKRQTGPLAIGGNVAAANLIHRVEPTYPTLAKTARIQGLVVFQAVIGADGHIRDLQLQQGPPLLVESAKSAILQWRYRPTLLNGKPVEVLTTITVRFSLTQ